MAGVISGLVGKMLSFIRVERNGAKLSDVKVDLGGNDIRTAENTQTSGDDSFPLVNDQPSLIKIQKSGRILVIGWAETDASQKALEGDKRIYARDPADRTESVELWLKNDGTASLDNENGSVVLSPDGSIKGTSPNGDFELRADGSHKTKNSLGYIELKADGSVDINGTIILPTGQVTALVSVTAPAIIGSSSVAAPSIVANGKEMDGHVHSGVSSGGSNTGPNV